MFLLNCRNTTIYRVVNSSTFICRNSYCCIATYGNNWLRGLVAISIIVTASNNCVIKAFPNSCCLDQHSISYFKRCCVTQVCLDIFSIQTITHRIIYFCIKVRTCQLHFQGVVNSKWRQNDLWYIKVIIFTLTLGRTDQALLHSQSTDI